MNMHPAQAYAASVDVSTITTFRALAEALIPNTPALAVYGAEQVPGAAELCIHEYMIWELDHALSVVIGLGPSIIPLSEPTAHLLNSGAVQFTQAQQAECVPNPQIWHISPFASLAPIDRIRVLTMLEEVQIDLGDLPLPYTHNGGWITFMVSFLNRQMMFGNYSEWNAYGSTRLLTPIKRRLEYFPISWRQVKYPGVQPGYRVFMGYKLTIVREGGTSTVVSN